MKNAETKDRIKKALEIREMKQSELVEKTGIDKGQMSSYLAGRYKPKQENLSLIAQALNVDEAWLMGYDVPMERNEYEDPTLLKREADLESIDKILEADGYLFCCENYDDDYFIIKNSINQTIASFYDYELLPIYESLKRKGKVTAELLLSSKTAFFRYLESLGYCLYWDTPEHRPFISSKDVPSCILKHNTLDSLKLRIDSFAKATVDSELLALKEEEIRKERLEKERTLRHLSGENIYEGTRFEKDWNTDHLAPEAAHERTDISKETHTEELMKQEDGIMDDPNF